MEKIGTELEFCGILHRPSDNVCLLIPQGCLS